MLAGIYFCIHISHLFDFDTGDMASFDTKIFFLRKYSLAPFVNRHQVQVSNEHT